MVFCCLEKLVSHPRNISKPSTPEAPLVNLRKTWEVSARQQRCLLRADTEIRAHVVTDTAANRANGSSQLWPLMTAAAKDYGTHDSRSTGKVSYRNVDEGALCPTYPKLCTTFPTLYLYRCSRLLFGEREKFQYIHSASLAYEDGSVFMSGPFAEWL